jgi:monovalent cation:H+ antiporter-2, CPA2 family
MTLEALLADLAIVFTAGVVAVLALGRIGLPPVVGFLVGGLIIGPSALGLIVDPHTIDVLAELGVALLLFTIGLEFSFSRLARIGRFVALGGTLQVGLTVAAAVAVAWGLGATGSEGVVWGYMAAVSSTAIVLRLLSDRGELDAPHGRFVVGVLIFQDLCIVPMMLTVPLLAGEGASVRELATVLIKAAGVVVAVVFAARRVVPRLLGVAAHARSPEVFVLTALLVATGVAWATASMGLSIALGAFLAGIVVAETEFVHQVFSQVSPIRDALASLFFVSVGMLLDPLVLIERPLEVAGLVVLLVAGKLVLVAVAVLVMRFPARVALLSGLALAQVGEFSFVVMRSAQGAGLVGDEAAATFLAASVVTMIAAPLLVAWSPRLAAGARLLRPLERLLALRDPDEPHREDPPLRDHVVVGGVGMGGRTLIRSLEAARVPYVGLELDPETVIAERNAGLQVRYGDVTSPEVLDHVAHVGEARLVALLLSDVEGARRAATLIRHRFPDVPILLRVHRLERDAGRVSLPGVQVVAEDHEAAVEVVERVLRCTGVAGALIATAVATARGTRTGNGAPEVSPTGLAGTLHMRAVTLREGDRAAGATLAELDLRAATGASIVAYGRQGSVYPAPRPHDELRADDTVFLVGETQEIECAASLLTVGDRDGLG